MVAGKSPDWLPPGFAEKIKYKNGKKIKIYSHLSSGSKFHSMAAVRRYLSTVDQVDNVDKSPLDSSPQNISISGLGHSSEKEKMSSASKTIDNVDKSFPVISPESIPMTNTSHVSGKNTKNRASKMTDNMDKSSVDISAERASSDHVSGNKMKSGASKVTIETTTDDDLPPGWIKEIKITNYRNKIRRDPYYIDPVSRYVFRSKVDALRYVKTNDIGNCACKPFKRELKDPELIINEVDIDNVDKTTPDISPQSKLMTGTDHVSGHNTRSKVLKTVCIGKLIDNADKSCPNISPESISMASTSHGPEKKMKSALKKVAIETTIVQDLPPGWIKEIRTTKSRNKTRRDPFYTDPVSGYVFRSKLDALRYLKTNDIGSCVMKPFKRGLDDLKLINNEINSSNPGDEELSEPKKHLIEGDSNGGGASGTKCLAKSKVKRLKRKRVEESDIMKVTSVATDSIEETKLRENSHNYAEIDGTLAIKNQLSESGMKKKTNRTKVISKKYKSQKSSSLPSRSSRRLAACESAWPSSMDSHESSLTASDTGTKADSFSVSPLKAPASIPFTPPDTETNEVPEHELVIEKIVEEIKPLDNVGKRHAVEVAISENRKPHAVEVAIPENRKPRAVEVAIPENRKPRAVEVAIPENRKPHAVEVAIPENRKPHAVEVAIPENRKPRAVEVAIPESRKPHSVEVATPENRTGGAVNEKQPDVNKKPQESQLGYDFGDAWSDPLEFAFKTLCGEIPLEDNLRFSGDLNDPLNSPFNDGEAETFLKPSNSEEPMLFHNAFIPGFESSKQHGTIGQLELNSSPSSESLSKSSLPSSSLDQHVTIDLSLANPSFTQHETIAITQANSSAPFNQYWAVGQSQASLKQYGTVGSMQANSSFSPSFRPPGTVSQWPPTHQSLFSTPGTIGFSTLNSFNVQSSADAGRKNGQTKFNP